MLLRLLVLSSALCLGAQQPDIPTQSDMTAYREFRVWLNSQPDARERLEGQAYKPELLARYASKLRAEGKAPAEIESAIAPLRKFGPRLEHELWNRGLTAEKPTFNTEPNAFLVAVTKGMKAGRALDVGMGQGRNSIWLAKQGWDVTGFDPADRALALANKLASGQGVKIRMVESTAEQFDFGQGQWDLILFSYAGGREVREKVVRALKPGGVVIVEAFHRDATRQSSIGSSVVFDSNELLTLFPGLRVLHYEDTNARGDFGLQETRVVRLMAQRPE